MGFDRLERDRCFQRSDGYEIDAIPFSLLSRFVGVSFSSDLGEADDFLADNAVVEEHGVAFAHVAQILTRLEIAYAGPRGAAIQNELLPRVGGGLCFYQPVAGRFRHGAVLRGMRRRSRKKGFLQLEDAKMGNDDR